MSEDRSEYPQIEAASVTAANDRLRIRRPRDADAWIPPVGRRIPSHVGRHISVARDPQIAIGLIAARAAVEFRQSTLSLSVHRLGEVKLVAHSVVDRKRGQRPPAILEVEEISLLKFLRVDGGTDIAAEVAHVAQHKAGHAQTCIRQASIRSGSGIEGKKTRTIGIAGYAQVPRVAQIDTEPIGVVSRNFRPVRDQLKLVLSLRQRAVTTRNVEAGTVLRPGALTIVRALVAGAVSIGNVEPWRTAGEGITRNIQAGYSQLRSEGSRPVIFGINYVVAVVADSPVRQQLWTDCDKIGR